MKRAEVLVLTMLLGASVSSRSASVQAEPPQKQPATAHAHHHQPLAATAPIDGESVFQLASVFKNEDGKAVSLGSFAGRPTLVVMFYGTCKTLCPILVEDARAIDNSLSVAQRAELRVVLVTLDPERDTAERLRALASERKLERPRWTLLRGSDKDIRELAMVLGVQYRRLDNGDFAHSAVLTLLDARGRVASRIEGLSQPNGELVQKLRALLTRK